MASVVQALGIIGYPLGHSLSPLMHTVALRHLGLPYRYQAYEVEPGRLKGALEGVRALGIRGVNVTIPHKQAVLPYLDELSEEARLMGAVNTITREADGRLIGHNTDGVGFLTALREEGGLSGAGLRVAILGAGGASRALAAKLLREGAGELAILNRTPGRAAALAEELRAKFPGSTVAGAPLGGPEAAEAVAGADLLVNATSAGLKGGAEGVIPVSPDLLRPGLVVCDIVYNPLMTPLLLAAKAHKARPITGLGMFIHQGAESFRIWTGCEMPIGLVRRRLLRALRGGSRV
ncbi:MAG: shikimate dehydrogenase [Nitrospinota bacterium]